MSRQIEHARIGRARRALVRLVLTTGLAGLALVAIAPGDALAQPWLTSLTPTRVSAGTEQLVTIFGTGIGYAGDVVRFPGNADAYPSAYAPGWVTVAVPQTY